MGITKGHPFKQDAQRRLGSHRRNPAYAKDSFPDIETTHEHVRSALARAKEGASSANQHLGKPGSPCSSSTDVQH